MKVSSVMQMRAMDRAAAVQFGIPEELLMENAGLAAITLLSRKYLDHLSMFNVVIFCGSGNNGGDGLVVARQLHSLGSSITVVYLSKPVKFGGASGTNYDIADKSSLSTLYFEDIPALKPFLGQFDLVIDAMLGTGITRSLQGDYLSAVEEINASAKPVLSLDIPSGINGDTGQIHGNAVKANWTITFGLPKIGNLLYPGYQYCGELFVSHISFPPELYHSQEIKVEINSSPPLPCRNPDGHKGSFGQALFVAGAANYLGAPYFSAMAFLKSGGGYARLATPKSISPYIAQKGNEIVFHPMMETRDNSLALDNFAEIISIAKDMDVVVLGPGTSLAEETQELLRQLSAEIEKPILVDGDGLTALCSNPNALKIRKEPTILTPHLGEMARLTKKSVAEIKSSPIAYLQEYCQKWNAIIVLKGAHTLIGFPDQRVFINLSGNSGMATAGSGDVLNGVIAAMYGLGLNLEDAVCSGVFLHGLSGDLAAENIGADGMTAQDILAFLPAAMRIHRDSEKKESRYLKYSVPRIC